MELDVILALPLQLPSSPRVVALLLNELDQDEPDLQDINQLLGSDVALTLRLLQSANSRQPGLCGQVGSVAESLAVLPLSQVRTLVIAAAAAAALRSAGGLQFRQFWTHSLEVARLARALARLVRQNQQAAFTCGLIHAFGELVLHQALPRQSAQIDEQIDVLDRQRAAREKQVFSYDYPQVGAGLTRQWCFPQPIADAIEYQESPFEGAVYEPLAGVLHLAVWRVRARQSGFSANALATSFPGEVGDVLGLDIDMVLQQDALDWRGRQATLQ